MMGRKLLLVIVPLLLALGACKGGGGCRAGGGGGGGGDSMSPCKDCGRSMSLDGDLRTSLDTSDDRQPASVARTH